MSFVHLHTHTEFSLFDGAGKQIDFVRKAKEHGCPAIAMTEHGSLRGLYKLHMACTKDVGEIKPIFGIEFYLAEDLHQHGLPDDVIAGIRKAHPRGQQGEAVYQAEVAAGVRERFHLTILAKNNDGLRSLYRLSSTSWIEGFYKRPRIDMKALQANREGLIVLSGCLSGPICTAILKGDFDLALERAEQLSEWFGEDFYIELMPHSLPEQVVVNKALLRIAEALGLNIVATQDAHYIERGDWRYQEALLCVHTKDVLSNPQRFKFDTHDFWLRSRPEMAEAFRTNHGGFMDIPTVRRALDATLEVSEKCVATLEIDRFKALVPPVPIPAEFGGDEFRYMVHLCQEGWDTRKIAERVATTAPRFARSYAAQYQVYVDRLKHELGAIKRQKVVRYFLVVWDMYKWVRAQGIQCGPGRGSAGGSIVSFLLGITDIDPIEHRLIFERFLSPFRIDLPDIDCDFEDVRREEVITFLRGRYGDDKTCQISTTGTLKGKACLKDLGRVMGIPFEEVNAVTNSIIERSSGDERASSTIEDSFREFKVCQEFNEKYPQVLQYAKKLEGQAKSVGVHAAGVIVSPVPLVEVIPLETRQVHGKVPTVMSALDMYGAQGVGLMKLDILGIRNLTVIRECLSAIKERHGVDVDLDWIDLNDMRVLDLFTAHDYVGIFQYDTPSADKISEGVKFTSFEDVAAMIALDRPGTARSGLATEYLKRKQDPSKIKSIHPIVDKICEDTYGVIVYQEHVIRIFVELAGYAPGTADSLRHKIAKKHGAESLGKEREEFIAGAVSRGCDAVTAEKLIDQIKMFGSYGFNRAHSVAYGLIAYREMFLKTYYPVEFYWALLKNEPERDQITRVVKDARKHEIDVRAPDVNIAGEAWKLVDEHVIGALTDLKGLGPASIAPIVANQPFKSFTDFMERAPRRLVNKRVVTVLLKAGAMESLVPNTKWLLEHLDEVWDLHDKLGWEREVVRRLVASAAEPGFTDDDQQMLAAEVNPLAFGKHPLEPWQDWLASLGTTFVPMNDDTAWDLGSGWLYGQILEIKYNQVGDFHTGTAPTEAEKRRMRWGARYANLNLEDVTGAQRRVKVDVDIFETYRHIIDKGVGTIVAAHVNFNKRFKSTRAHFLIDMVELRNKLKDGSPVSPFESALVRDRHPVAPYNKLDIRKVAKPVGLVTHVNRKLDKKNNEMAFFGLLGFDGFIEGIVFASSWPSFSAKLLAGAVVEADLRRDGTSHILDSRGGALKLLAAP